MIRKKKGFVLLPVVLATFIMGMLGIGLASMYSGTFSTMNAGKAASKAKDFATIEGNYVKLNGYDTASSMTHDWESLSDLVGPDATGWQSKVETSSTATSADGNQVKVMKVAVKKDSDIASRYTYEVPVVQGKDSYTKAEIDAMMSVVNGNFTKVNNRIDAMIEDTNNIKTQINNLYADMDSLNKNLDKLHTLVENYRTSLLNSINGVQGNLDAEIAARKAADASESSARQSADNALNKRCDNIDGKIKDLQGALSNTQERVKSLEGRVSSLEGRTKNLEDRASALESGLDAETKARIAADKSITDELHSVRDNLTEKYKALKTSVDDIGGKVKNMSKDVKANTDNIASINELLKNSFVFNGKHNHRYSAFQTGDTDSERFFLSLLDNMNEHISRAVPNERERFEIINNFIVDNAPRNKLNLIIYDGDMLYVHKNLKNTLCFKRLESGMIFSTKPLDNGVWIPFPMAQVIAYKNGREVYRGDRHKGTFVPSLEYITAMDAMYI